MQKSLVQFASILQKSLAKEAYCMRKTISRKPITISEVAEEFYRSNKAKGLASATCEIYKTYISAFIQW